MGTKTSNEKKKRGHIGMQNAFCLFSFVSEECAGLGNGCERFCASRSLLGSYVHQELM